MTVTDVAPDRRARTARPGRGAALTAAVAALPLVLLSGSAAIGGGPKTVSDDVALLMLAARDALHGGVLVGPYSRYGWHHPGPSYFYLLAVPTWLWHSPTGMYVVVPLIAAVCAAGLALLARRGAGPGAGWAAAGAVGLVVAGLGGTTVRDPWNPYVVALPALLSVTASGLGAAGVPGALPWAAVAGTIAVQTHVSTAPVVLGVLAAAAVVRLVRRLRRGPAGLPWWRPETGAATVLLVAAWVPPLWDQVFRTGNLHSIWRFFTASHPAHGWSEAWRTVAAVFEVALFQRHAGIQEGVAAAHPALVMLLFAAVAVAAIALGAWRHRPVAVWLGAASLLGAALAVESVTRVVGPVFRYLVAWMAVLPAVPLVALATALVPGRPTRAGRAGSAGDHSGAEASAGGRWRPAASAALAVVVLVPFGLALHAVARTPPAVDLTDHDIQSAYRLVAPVVGPRGTTVRIEITASGRWPAAAGVGLELVRHGHPIRVQPPWPLLFGDRRRATGREPVAIVVAGIDPSTWPPPGQATKLGRAGPEYLFVRHPA